MSLQILHSPTAAAVAAATSQEGQVAALVAAWGSGDVTVRIMNGTTLRETQTYGPWVLGTSAPRTLTLGSLLARTVASTGTVTSVVYRAGATDIFSLSTAVSPAAGDVVFPAASGGVVATARTNLSDAVLGKITISANPALPVADVAATGFTLSVSPATALNGVTSTVTVTPNGPVPSGGVAVLLAASNGGVLGNASMSFTGGTTLGQSTTISRASVGTSVVSMTNTGGLTNGTPQNFSSVATAVPSTGTPQPFTLTASGSGVLPFAIGYAMSQGHVPSGSSLSFTGATAKLKVLSTWPDGSARHGIIAGTYTSAGSAVTVTPTVATVAAGTALTGAAVQTAMGANTAVFDAGAFGSATFSGADFASPFVTHAATDGFIEAIYRKQIGTDAHLVAWLALRVWASGAVEALPWIENGYLQVTGPTNKSATYTFTLGGTSRFSATIDLPHHCRTPLVSGSLLSHWLGTDPGVTAQHDRAYLQATELVPTYAASIDSASSLVTGLPSTFTPLQQGSYDYAVDAMSSPGYASPIGLLPQHDALYLLTTANLSAQVQRNAYSAGRYPIHWRDETTNRPPVFATYPNLVIGASQGVTNTGTSATSQYTPSVSGTAPPQWDLAHCPSVGFLAYLLTGRYFHMETAQFAAVTNHFHQGDNIRSSGSAVMRSFPGANDTRHAAWGIRSLMQALVVTPDSDTAQRNNYKASLQATIDFHHARYVAQSHNPLGFTEPGGDYGLTGAVGERLWMQDFSVACWGYLKAVQPALDSGYSSKITAFFNWHAPAVVGRLGDPDDPNAWPANNPAHYTGAIAASDAPDWVTGTGPWYSTFRAAYNATISTPPVWLSTNKLQLGAEILPGANSFLGNLLPAISYAVRHGVTNAQAAYRRLCALDGYGRLIQDLQTTPVWGVKPASGALPSWAEGSAAMTWITIPNSTLAGSPAAASSTPGDTFSLASKMGAFSGIVRRGTRVGKYATGGHMDGNDNGVREIDIGLDNPVWELKKASTWNGTEQLVARYASGDPASRHTYRNVWWVPQLARVMLIGCRYVWGNPGTSFNDVAGWNPANNTYDGAIYSAPIAGAAAFDPITGVAIGCYTQSGAKIAKWVASTDTHSNPCAAPTQTATFARDTKRNQWFAFGWGDGSSGGSSITAFTVNDAMTATTNITITGSGVSAFTSAAPLDNTMVYSQVLDAFFFWDGATKQLFKIVPNGGTTWTLTVQSIAGTPPANMGYSFSRAEIHDEIGMMSFDPDGAFPMKAVRLY